MTAKSSTTGGAPRTVQDWGGLPKLGGVALWGSLFILLFWGSESIFGAANFPRWLHLLELGNVSRLRHIRMIDLNGIGPRVVTTWTCSAAVVRTLMHQRRGAFARRRKALRTASSSAVPGGSPKTSVLTIYSSEVRAWLLSFWWWRC